MTCTSAGGTMAEIPFASYDPVFFAHHVMIDRLWRLWQLRHPTAVVPAELLSEALPPCLYYCRADHRRQCSGL